MSNTVWYRMNSDAYNLSNSICSFPRTVDGADMNFDMEPKLPKLQNLAGHVTECKGAKDDMKRDELTSEEWITTNWNAEMMEAYLKEGKLNPEVVATYRGFLCIFLPWIFDKSLPWTAREASTLQMLFKYLKITYQLPSNTTVCNQLLHIFEKLHWQVVCEFAVSIFLLNASDISFSEFLQAAKSKITQKRVAECESQTMGREGGVLPEAEKTSTMEYTMLIGIIELPNRFYHSSMACKLCRMASFGHELLRMVPTQAIYTQPPFHTLGLISTWPAATSYSLTSSSTTWSIVLPAPQP